MHADFQFCVRVVPLLHNVGCTSHPPLKFVQFEIVNYTLVDMSSLQNVNFVSKTKG